MPERPIPVQLLELWVEGQAVCVPQGTSVLAALQNAGHHTLHLSLGGEPRGALCGMGACLECRALVNGRLARTCLTSVQDGQHVTLLTSERAGREQA